jgi:hypothetical protein
MLGIVTPSGCWEWQGYRDDWNYGTVRFDGKMQRVHRVVAHLCLGLDLSSGLRALHHCDNPPCFNPDHLFIGTDADNAHDRDAKGRQWQMKKTHCKQGHPLSGDNLLLVSGKRQCRMCNALRSASYWIRKGKETRQVRLSKEQSS